VVICEYFYCIQWLVCVILIAIIAQSSPHTAKLSTSNLLEYCQIGCLQASGQLAVLDIFINFDQTTFVIWVQFDHFVQSRQVLASHHVSIYWGGGHLRAEEYWRISGQYVYVWRDYRRRNDVIWAKKRLGLLLNEQNRVIIIQVLVNDGFFSLGLGLLVSNTWIFFEL
jgi:hypothetical protein